MFNLSTNVSGQCFCGVAINTIITEGKAVAICPVCGSSYPIVIDSKGLRIEGGKVSNQAISQLAVTTACANLGITESRVTIKTPVMERTISLAELAGSLLGSFDTVKAQAQAFVGPTGTAGD